jgi:hypothetical protein
MVAGMEPHEDPAMTTPIASPHTGSALSGGSRLAAWVIGVGRGLWLLPLDIAFRTVGLRYGWLRALFGMAPPRLLASIGQLRAERAACFFVNDTAATQIYTAVHTLALHDALPISRCRRLPARARDRPAGSPQSGRRGRGPWLP